MSRVVDMGSGPIPFVRLRIQERDRHRWLTVGALLAVGIALTMAVVGLPPVDLHGPLHRLGIMDPLCGGTRAARYTARGNLSEAWRYNPLSILIVYGGALAIVRSGVGFVFRRWVTLVTEWTPARRRWAIAIVVSLLVLLEIRQQLRADLLMTGTDT